MLKAPMPAKTPRSRDTLAADPSDRLPASGGGAPPRRPKREGGRGKAPRKAKAPRGRSWFRRLLAWGVTVSIWIGIALAGVVAYYAIDLPDIERMTATSRRPSVQFVSVEGETFAAYGDIYGQPLELKDISPYIPQAVIATEDRRFYSHFGVDLWGLARAALTNLRAGRVVQGGSTITQQLAKNLFLTPERSLKRKVQELLMALWLENRFSKDQILALYLNRVYLGSGTFGVDAAAKRFFDVSARKTTLYQSAVIAGLLKAPSRYSPLNDPEASHRRTVEVLNNMVEAGFLDQKTVDMAALQGAAQATRRPAATGRYFADWLMGEIAGMAELQGRDLIVHTTLDAGLQRAAEKALKELIDKQGTKSKVAQGAVVVMTPDGAVRALVGGADYDDSQFNRATQARRQPGSAFKPFVYLAALEHGLAPHDVFDDAPIKLGNWTPGNYNGRYEGPVTLHHAFAQSTNTVAVRLIDEVGPARVAAVAHRLGISSRMGNDASLALGTSEVTLLELTTAYAPFANGGDGVAAFGIDRVTGPDGKVIWRRQGGGFGQVTGSDPLAGMHELMRAVVEEGTGKAARLDRPAAGKTGTTQDYRDAWFMGFTADYVAGVWLGNDDQRNEMRKVTGGGLPAQLWKTVMLAAHRGLPARELPTPVQPAPEIFATEGTAGGWPTAETSGGGDPVRALGNAIDGLLDSLFGR